MLAPVTNTLATVAAKSHAFVRHASVRGGTRSRGSAAESLEGVTEGGGEALESWGEAGIDGSYVGVQPEFSARKRGVVPDLDGSHCVEAGVGQCSPERLGVQRVRVDRRAAGSSRLVDHAARQRYDALGLQPEGRAEEALGQRDRQRNDSVHVALESPLFFGAQRKPSRSELRASLLLCLLGRGRGGPFRLRACIREQGVRVLARFLDDPLRRSARPELFAGDALALEFAR